MTQSRMVQIERDILAKNDGVARATARWLAERGIFALNLVSSPGSGKTTLLVRTIEALKRQRAGRGDRGRPADHQRRRPHPRHRRAGDPDQHRQGLPPRRPHGRHALEQLALADGCVLFIENVGNLVCPAGFDLGEAHKVVVLSVTEGEDKPLKYPDMFPAASPDAAEQVRPAAAPDLRRRALPRQRAPRQPGDRDDPGLGDHRRGHGRLAGLDRRGARAARQQRLDKVAALQRRVAELEAQIARLRSP